MFDNFAAGSLAAQQKSRAVFFAKGLPFYTEMKGRGMYTKEFNDGGILAVKRHFGKGGTITEEVVKMLTESPMARVQDIKTCTRSSCG